MGNPVLNFQINDIKIKILCIENVNIIISNSGIFQISIVNVYWIITKNVGKNVGKNYHTSEFQI